MGKNAGVAYPGDIEMILLPPIPTEGNDADDIMELLLRIRSSIARELT